MFSVVGFFSTHSVMKKQISWFQLLCYNWIPFHTSSYILYFSILHIFLNTTVFKVQRPVQAWLAGQTEATGESQLATWSVTAHKG